MNTSNQIIIEIPFECDELFGNEYKFSEDYFGPVKEDSMMCILSDLNQSNELIIWMYLLKYRYIGQYTYSPVDLKKRFGISESTARRARLNLQEKGYLIPINTNKLRFVPFPERLVEKLKLEEPEKGYKIYKFTFPNGKCYIGQTKQTLNQRWGTEGRGYQGQRVYEAIKEFGWDNIKKELLASDLSSNEATNLEHICIKLYNSIEDGYNDIP